jgi:hypothetical protein
MTASSQVIDMVGGIKSLLVDRQDRHASPKHAGAKFAFTFSQFSANLAVLKPFGLGAEVSIENMMARDGVEPLPPAFSVLAYAVF